MHSFHVYWKYPQVSLFYKCGCGKTFVMTIILEQNDIQQEEQYSKI